MSGPARGGGAEVADLVSPQGAFVADLDLSAGRLGLLQQLPLPAAGRATAAAGDVTGDGVDDLVVATGDRIELYAGGVAAP